MPHDYTAQHKQPIIIHCTITGNSSEKSIVKHSGQLITTHVADKANTAQRKNYNNIASIAQL